MENIIILILSILVVYFYLKSIKKSNYEKDINNKLEARNTDKKKRFNTDLPELNTLKSNEYREILNEFNKIKTISSIPLGRNELGELETIDLDRLGNMLILGTTGGGKSVLLNELIMSIILNYTKEEIKFITIDSSIVELSSFNGIPHYIKDTISDMTVASNELELIVKEEEKRKNQESIKEHLFVIIDDIYDLAYGQEKYINNLLIELIEKSKNTKVHIIAATDTPIENEIFKNYSDLFDLKCYLTLAPGTYNEFDEGKTLNQEELNFISTIGNMILVINDAKKKIKIADILDEDIKEIVKYYSI